MAQGRLASGDHSLKSPVFYTRPGECREQPRTPFEEAVKAARQIHKDQSLPLSLCLSGGVDSECMLRAFVKAEVPFRTFIFRYRRQGRWQKDWNHHDTRNALELCRRFGIEPFCVEVQTLDYFRSGQVFQDSQDYLCPSPQLCLHIHMLKKIPGCPIFAWNAPNFESYSAPSGHQYGVGLPGFKYFSYQRYFDRAQREGIPFFFLYTPELLYSFLRLPTFQKLLKNKSAQGSPQLKWDLYTEGGFTLENPRPKFTGFEQLRIYLDQQAKNFDQFNLLYRYPLEKNLAQRCDFPKSEISLLSLKYLEDNSLEV